MQDHQLIKYFSNYLHDLGYSRGTVYQLPRHIKDLSAHHHHRPLPCLSPEELTCFYHRLRRRPNLRRAGGLSGHYINRYLYAIQTFYNWLERTGQLTKNPVSILDLPRLPGESRHPLTRPTIQKLFAGCEDPMETALLHVYYSCGLRRSEGTRLNTSDVSDGLLHVHYGKGAKRRTIPLPPGVSRALRATRHHPRRANTGATGLLLNGHGTRMSGCSANRLLQALCERAGINEKVSLHHLRHSIATHLLEEGLAVEQVRDFLGHACLETTQHYTKVTTWQTSTLLHSPT